MKEEDFKIGDDVHLKNGVKATIHGFETRDGVLYASSHGHLKPVKDIIKQLNRVIRDGEIIFGEEEKITDPKTILINSIRSIEDYVNFYVIKDEQRIAPSGYEEAYNKAIITLKQYIGVQ